MTDQLAFDFAKLDTIAVDLDLLIEPSKKDDGPVGEPAAQVSRAIDAVIATEGVGLKTLSGSIGQIEIATGHIDAGQTDFTSDPDRLKAVCVDFKNQDLRIRNRSANGDRPVGCESGRYMEHGGADGKFCRAIGIDVASSGSRECAAVVNGLFACRHERLETPQLVEANGAQVTGRDGGDSDPSVVDEFDEPSWISGCRLRHCDQSRPGKQRHEDLRERGVEGAGGELQNPVVGRHAECVDLAVDHVDKTFVLHHDAFGKPGGARGIDDVGQVSAAGDRLEIFNRCELVESRGCHHRHREGGQQLGVRGIGENGFTAAVFEQIARSLHRERRIDRHIRSTRLHDRQQGGCERAPAGDEDAHRRFSCDIPMLPQRLPPAVRSRVQIAV